MALLLLWVPASQAQVPKEVMDKILRAETKAGQEAAARDYGLQSISSGSANLGVGTGGAEYLRNLYKSGDAFVPPAGSRLSSLNSSLTYFGAALAAVQVASDLQAGNYGQAASSLAQGSLYTWAALIGGPVGAIFFASDVIGRGSLYVVDNAFNDDRWWTAYEKYYLTGSGRLEPSAWVGLFERSDPSLGKFKAHMGLVWNDDLYVRENAPSKLGSADSTAVARLKEAYSIRYFKKHLEPRLAAWAAQKAAQEAEEYREKVNKAIRELVAESYVEVSVVDDQTNEALKAWVKGLYLDGGSQAKETPDGIWTHLTTSLKGIPPWASGTILVGECDGFESRNQNFAAQSLDDFKQDKVRRLQVRLRPVPAALEIHLTDMVTNKDVPGAELTAAGVSGVVTAQSGSTGSAFISLNRSGPYQLQVSKKGYEPLTQSVRAEPLSASNRATVVTLRLQPQGLKVQAQATPAIVQPGQRFEVTAHIEGGNPPFQYAWKLNREPLPRADDKEKLSGILEKPPGIYIFTARVTDRDGLSGEGQATVTLEGIPLDLTLLSKGPKNTPVVGAEVVVRSGGVTIKARSGAHGRLMLAVPAGPSVVVMVSAPGFAPVKREITLGGPSPRAVIEMSAGLEVTLVADATSVMLGQRVKLSAQTTGGVPPYQLEWSLDEKSLPKASGKTEMTGILKEPAGRRVFKVEVRDREGMIGTQSLVVLVTQSGQLRVEVRDKASGQAIAGAQVGAAGGDSVTSDVQGVAVLNVTPGQRFDLMVGARGYKSRKAHGQVDAGQSKTYVCLLEAQSPKAETPVNAGAVDTRFDGRYKGGWSVSPEGLKGAETPFGESGEIQLEIHGGQVGGTLRGDPRLSSPGQGTVSGNLMHVDKNGIAVFQGQATVNVYYKGSFAKDLGGEMTHAFPLQGKVRLKPGVGLEFEASGQYPATHKVLCPYKGFEERSFAYRISLSAYRR